MSSTSFARVGRCAVVLLALALAVPFLSGCSTLGIATSDDLTAMESSLRNSNNATNTRIDNVEKSTGDMQAELTQMTTSLDSLNVRFARAATWLETMSLDTIAEDSKNATEQARAAAAISQDFFKNYLEWIKAQHAALDQQIKTLEAQVNKAPADTPEKADTKPADSGGGDSSGDQDKD
jgi:hypothetical protein